MNKDYIVSLEFVVTDCKNHEEAKQQFLEVVARKDYLEKAWKIEEIKS